MGMQDQIPANVEGQNLADNILGKTAEGSGFSLYINADPTSALGGMRGLRNSRHTFVIQRNNEGKVLNYFLFDNINDPYQLQNIADAHPELIEKYTSQVFEKIRKINDPWILYGQSIIF